MAVVGKEGNYTRAIEERARAREGEWMEMKERRERSIRY